jgi:RNA polymerase sigma-70 factor (ECF subfamily)
MAKGPEVGLHLLDDLESRNQLAGYYLLSAARADFHRRLKQWPEAAMSYREALSQVTNQSERRFLNRRLQECETEIAETPARMRGSAL